MKPHPASENSNAGGLFPFLAVLLCTMGALLVLLVVLAQRAGQKVLSEQTAAPQVAAVKAETLPQELSEAAELTRQLQEVRTFLRQLSDYRKQAERQVRDEERRLSHLEEHSRRLELELARLAIAAQQLDATEKNQTVDQQQAENELARLRKLIAETETQLDELRKAATGERSYAIIPYKGPNGTFRKPIYIECYKEGVIIRPEGIRFEASDFAAPNLPGNPLAAAIRASREYLKSKAAKAGQPEPPDPYPLLLVRPDGIQQYHLARTAITSWDSDFGYEFIDDDWKLSYPELADPQLAQVQQHSLMIAREQLAHWVRAAPSRFRGAGGIGGSSSMASGGTANSHGYGGGQAGESNEHGALAQSANGQSESGDGSAEGASATSTGAGSDEYQYGATGGNAQGAGNGLETASLADGTGSEGSAGAEDYGGAGGTSGGSLTGESYSGGMAQTGGSSAQGNSNSASSTMASSNGAFAVGQITNSEANSSLSMTTQNVSSIAESRGKNWAIERGAHGAVPIRRPIHVVVRQDQIALLPSRHAHDGVEATGTVISLNQSPSQISTEFVAALRARVDEWGLAGNGLYWRPVLELNIAPDAQQTAQSVRRLLHDSGVEIQLPETAPSGSQVQARNGDRDNAIR